MTEPPPIRIAIITASTRPGRRGPMVTDWVYGLARDHLAGAERSVEIGVVDLAEVDLPLLDEPLPAAMGGYDHEHTRAWAQTIESFDAFVIVVPEYNHSAPASVKNAIDYLFTEWNDKAAGFVSYGINGGVRAVEHLRAAMTEVKVACVRSQVALGLFTDFDIPDISDPGTFTPADRHTQVATRMLDEVIAWAGALRPLRTGSPA